MCRLLQRLPLYDGFTTLTGNIRISVLFEIPFSIGSALYSFYLSLYMKECGLTDGKIGWIVVVGYIAGIFFASMAAQLVNYFGRKRSTLWFELAAYPLSCLIYLFSSSFWGFMVGRIISSTQQISTVAWNFMVVEDADDEQRTVAFNILTLLHTATGIITPLLGLMVAQWGVVRAERGFLLVSCILFTSEMLIRHHYYTETQMGHQLMQSHRRKMKLGLGGIPAGLPTIFSSVKIGAAVLMNVLYNMTYPLTTHFSLYLNLYLTNRIGIDNAEVSLIGGVNSLGILFSGMLLIPLINRHIVGEKEMCATCGMGFFLQIPYAVMMIYIPRNSLLLACVAIIFYAFGYSLTKTYTDSLLATVTQGVPEQRGDVYALMNVAVSFTGMLSTGVGSVAYMLMPESLFWISIGLLSLTLAVSILLYCYMKKEQSKLLCKE